MHHRPATALAGMLLTAAAALLASLLLLASAHASTPEPQFGAAYQRFMQAMRGDSNAIPDAAEQFEALLKADPTDPVLLAYAGASTAMKATTTLLPWRKMAFAEDGLAQIDKGLALLQPVHDAPRYHGTPASLETRFVAAGTFLRLPSLFKRQTRGQQLLDDVLNSPLLARAPLGFRGAVWMRAGEQALVNEHKDDAKRWFAQVVQQNAPQADAARAKLKELP
jgi:hypothetical protein